MHDVFLGAISLFGGIITMIGGVLVAKISAAAKHAESAAIDSRDTINEVRNSHTTNLRDDIDQRHAEIMGVLEDHGSSLEALHTSHRHTQEQITGLHESDATLFQSLSKAHDLIVALAMAAIDQREKPNE